MLEYRFASKSHCFYIFVQVQTSERTFSISLFWGNLELNNIDYCWKKDFECVWEWDLSSNCTERVCVWYRYYVKASKTRKKPTTNLRFEQVASLKREREREREWLSLNVFFVKKYFIFSQDRYSTNLTMNNIWCAWDSKLGRQDGKYSLIHLAMAAPVGSKCLYDFYRCCERKGSSVKRINSKVFCWPEKSNHKKLQTELKEINASQSVSPCRFRWGRHNLKDFLNVPSTASFSFIFILLKHLYNT